MRTTHEINVNNKQEQKVVDRLLEFSVADILIVFSLAKFFESSTNFNEY